MKKRILAFILVIGLLVTLGACAPAGLPPVPVNAATGIDGTVFVLYEGTIYREDSQGFAPIAGGAEEMAAYDGRIYYTSQKGKHCTLMRPDGTVEYESDLTYALRGPQVIRRYENGQLLIGGKRRRPGSYAQDDTGTDLLSNPGDCRRTGFSDMPGI